MLKKTQNWIIQVKQHERTILARAENVHKRTAELLKEQIQEYTPVGDPALWQYPPHANYVPGTLKAAWQLVFNVNQATIYNSTPYAYRVETGWSSQAPDGMMRRAILDFGQIFKQAVQEK